MKRSGTKWTVLSSLPFKHGVSSEGVDTRFWGERGGRILKKGFKRVLFFSINFCIDFGVDLGPYFGQKFDDFQRLLAFIFWL